MFRSIHRPFAALSLLLLTAAACCCLQACGAAAAASGAGRSSDEVVIYHLDPDPRGGRAYRLVYLVRVPLEVYWRFKTDFDNDFLMDHKYIREHRFISKTGNTVITGDTYTNTPEVFFIWQTTALEEARRLDFILLNPQHCGQAFHYGSIQMEAVEEGTRVTQVAYFDFLGASLWAEYPWGGGMKDFLTYTARWEQGTVVRLRGRYSGEALR